MHQNQWGPKRGSGKDSSHLKEPWLFRIFECIPDVFHISYIYIYNIYIYPYFFSDLSRPRFNPRRSKRPPLALRTSTTTLSEISGSSLVDRCRFSTDVDVFEWPIPSQWDMGAWNFLTKSIRISLFPVMRRFGGSQFLILGKSTLSVSLWLPPTKPVSLGRSMGAFYW